MSFLSNTAGKRPLVLLCVRLLIQSAMVWSIPLVGMDGLKAFHVLCGVDTINAGSTHSTQRAQPRHALPGTPWAP